jgi:arabinofuranosyltransferase
VASEAASGARRRASKRQATRVVSGPAGRAPGSRARRGLPGRLLVALLFLGLCTLIVLCAWQSDDAYITFRTVRNAWSGHGLTWNPGERVQAYTHPLWMILCLGCYGLTHEVYYSTLAVSILLAATAAALVVRSARGSASLSALALLLLGTSGAFVDYATSGLENPLLYLLLAVFVGIARREESLPRLRQLSLLTSAAGLTRIDSLLIVLPATLRSTWRLRREPRAVATLASGLLPLLVWEAFSLVYYGSLVPNSALAKLNIEIPLGALVYQGQLYFLDSLARDPITLTAIAAALALGVLRAGAAYRPILAGIGLYLIYLLRIGGDFMSGRFFAAPFVAAVAVLVGFLADRPWGVGRARWRVPASAGALCLFGLFWPGTRWTSNIQYGVGLTFPEIVRPTGIADERAYYYPSTGLLRLAVLGSKVRKPGDPLPPYPGAIEGVRFAQSPQTVAVWDEAGCFGFFSGDKTVIDVWALADPLLARIPFRPAGVWRIGHYERRLPAGYLESRQQGKNLLQDADLARCYDALVLVTRGPLFSGSRWREIWRLQTGHYAAVLRRQSGG